MLGFIKDLVYKTKVHSVAELRERINAAVLQVTNQMSEKTWLELDHRLDVLRATYGGHVETC